MNDLLDEIEKDILRESLNLGMGRAAAALSQLIDREVVIRLPELDLLPKRTAVDALCHKFDTPLWVIQHYFETSDNPARLSGHIFLFFQDKGPTTPIHDWIDAMDGAGHPPLSEYDIFQEVGNILLNACLSGMADLLSMELVGQPPSVHRTVLCPLLLPIVRREEDATSGIHRRRPPEKQDPVIQLLLHFDTPCNSLDGAVMIFLDLIGVPRLKQELHRIASQLA